MVSLICEILEFLLHWCRTVYFTSCFCYEPVVRETKFCKCFCNVHGYVVYQVRLCTNCLCLWYNSIAWLLCIWCCYKVLKCVLCKLSLRGCTWAYYDKAGVFAGRRRTVTREIGPFPCPMCYKTFTRKHDMKVHARNLHGEDRGPFQCVFCAQWSKNVESMRKHIANHHSNASTHTSS